MYYNKKSFVDDVCSKISFKEAHKSIREELKMHIDDLVECYIEEGNDEKEALIKAIDSMGNPKEIGSNLNKVYSKGLEWKVVIPAIILSLIGVMALLFVEKLPYGNGITFGVRHIISIFIGGFTVLIMYNVNYRTLLNNSNILYILGIILTFVTVSLGKRIDHSVFLQIGPISFEMAKFYNLIFLISIIGMLSKLKNTNTLGLLKSTLYMLFSLFALYINSNMGIVVIMTIVYLFVITKAILKDYFGIRKKWTCLAGIYGVAGCIIVSALSQSMGENFTSNWADVELSIMVSKFGLGFAAISIIMFIVLIGSVMLTTLKIKNNTAFDLSISIVIYLICSFIIGYLSNFGLLYGMDSHIPFVSFGPSNYITDSIIIGLFLSICRRNLIVESDMKYSLKNSN